MSPARGSAFTTTVAILSAASAVFTGAIAMAAPATTAPAQAHAAATEAAATGGVPAGHPALGGSDEALADVSEAAPALPRGVVEATIVSERGVPLVGTQVRLGILFQKVAEGESRSEKFAPSDATGSVRFSDLATGSEHAYRITVQAGPASYQTAPFNLREDVGQRVLLHVFPTTSDIEQARVGVRGYTYIETRDDVFQFEVLFRIFNVGQIAWVPKDVVVRLPKGFKAFKPQQGMTDVRFEQAEDGARLRGTFSPGQADASFRFQVPKGNEESASFRLSLLPHVADMRVIAEASSAMNLAVDGFQPPVATANQNGQRVLVAVKQVDRRDAELQDFVATLSGIPTPGPGRWVAVVLALGMAACGVFAARGAFDAKDGGPDLATDKKRAREILMRELLSLEGARQTERIGPRAYEQSRTRLIDAVARLGLPEGSGKAKRKQRRAAESKPPASS